MGWEPSALPCSQGTGSTSPASQPGSPPHSSRGIQPLLFPSTAGHDSLLPRLCARADVVPVLPSGASLSLQNQPCSPRFWAESQTKLPPRSQGIRGVGTSCQVGHRERCPQPKMQDYLPETHLDTFFHLSLCLMKNSPISFSLSVLCFALFSQLILIPLLGRKKGRYGKKYVIHKYQERFYL